LVLGLLFLVTPNVNGATLCTNGKANAEIVLGKDAIEPERNAAKELSAYLRKITGADFRIVETASVAKEKVRIFVGSTDEAKKVARGVDWSKLSIDGILIESHGNDLILAGDRPRGTLYAVYTFLEDYLGCRWWSPDAEYIPKKSTISVADMTYVYKPPFFSREVFYGSVCDKSNPKFAVKLKSNGNFEEIPESLGGHFSIIDWCHTFDQIMPRDKYFKIHPEWYSMVDGKRQDGYTQLCLTNREMRKEFIKNALELVGKNRSAGIISISQNDNTSFCTCPECTAAAKKYGGQSGLIIDFVNEVAAAIEKQYPEFWVETLAYSYSRHAPENIVPRKNVVVRLCSIEANFAKPLDSNANAEFRSGIHQWHKIADRLFVWDYTTNFCNFCIPHPNYYTMCRNIRFFRDNGAVAVFSQGDFYNRDTDFQPLRAWVLAKLQWNPDLDPNRLIDEYLDGYYGNAGPYMKLILDVYVKAVNRANYNLSCCRASNPYFKPDDYVRALRLFDKASAAVTDPVILDRIQVQRRSLEFSLFANDPDIRKQVMASGAESVTDIATWSREYYDWAVRTHNDYAKEGVKLKWEDFEAAGMVEIPKSKRTPVACRNIPAADWVELQGDWACLYGVGSLVYHVDDQSASDGKALRMPGSHGEWAIQMPLNAVVAKGIKRGEIFVSVRGKCTGDGDGFRFGLYDVNTDNRSAKRTVPASELSDSEYREFSLGVQDINSSSYVWVSPPKSEKVESIYVDRIFIKKSD
jgi:hypothetical protein